MNIDSLLDAISDRYAVSSAATEGISDYSELLAEVQLHHDESPVTGSHEKEIPSPMTSVSPGRYSFILDDVVVESIMYGGGSYTELMKDVVTIPPGSTVTISLACQYGSIGSIYRFNGIIAVINLLNARGVTTIFNMVGNVAVDGMTLMTVCSDVVVSDLMLLSLIAADFELPKYSALSDASKLCSDTIVRYLIDKSMVTADEIDRFFSNPVDNPIFVSSAELKARMSTT